MKLYIAMAGTILILGCTGTNVAQQTTSTAQSLYKAYQDYFPIGAAINPQADLVSEERMQQIAKHYNSITPENQMKPKQIHPKKDVWNWEPADRIVAFAKKNNMKVRGHTLVWQQNVPSYLVLENGSLVSKAELEKRLEAHITPLMQHYAGAVYCWDVVNEAISDNKSEIFRASDTLYAIAGEEYLDIAFKLARKADPGAKLFYNDFRFSDPVKRGKIYELMKRLKQRGVPIDGIGFQSHFTPGEVTREYLQETIDMFAALGLDIQVTELEVSAYKFRDKNSDDAKPGYTDFSAERQKMQQDFYSMIFDVYRRNKDKISGITFWGTGDMKDNFRTKRLGKMDYPFLFDPSMKPKNVYYAVTDF